jgi:hypothetical protein
MKWEYKGRKLENPLVILKRALLFIPFYICKILVCFMILLMWGQYQAKDAWENLS